MKYANEWEHCKIALAAWCYLRIYPYIGIDSYYRFIKKEGKICPL
jgi:hypothetical protein